MWQILANKKICDKSSSYEIICHWSYDKWVDKLGLPENFSIVNVTPWDQDIKWTGEGMLGEKNYMTKADYCLLVITIFLLQSIVWYSQTL